MCQVKEAEFQYRQCIDDATTQQDELEKVKERILVHVRKLICAGDTALKEVGLNGVTVLEGGDLKGDTVLEEVCFKEGHFVGRNGGKQWAQCWMRCM